MSACPGPCSPLSVTPSQWSGGPDPSPVSAADLLAGPGHSPLSGVSLLRPHSFRVPEVLASPPRPLGLSSDLVLWGCCLEAPLLQNSGNQEPALRLPRVGED